MLTSLLTPRSICRIEPDSLQSGGVPGINNPQAISGNVIVIRNGLRYRNATAHRAAQDDLAHVGGASRQRSSSRIAKMIPLILRRSSLPCDSEKMHTDPTRMHIRKPDQTIHGNASAGRHPVKRSRDPQTTRQILTQNSDQRSIARRMSRFNALALRRAAVRLRGKAMSPQPAGCARRWRRSRSWVRGRRRLRSG